MATQYALFIDELIDKRNFQDLTPEIRDELKNDAMERLDNFILEKLLATFSDESVETFITMIQEKKSLEELLNFAKDHIDNYETFIKSVYKDFTHSYVEIEE